MSSSIKQTCVKVGLVDSGVGATLRGSTSVLATRDFSTSNAAERDDFRDCTGHGDAVAGLVLEALPGAKLVIAKVFRESHTAGIDAVCSALLWLAEQELDLVNLSFGTHIYSQELEAACKAVALSGALLICSSPARGNSVFPAAFDCCISVTGDARCAPGEISWLRTLACDFGTHPFLVANRAAKGGGASYAAARFTGLAANLIAQGTPRDRVVTMLSSKCCFFGPERRGYGASLR